VFEGSDDLNSARRDGWRRWALAAAARRRRIGGRKTYGARARGARAGEMVKWHQCGGEISMDNVINESGGEIEVA